MKRYNTEIFEIICALVILAVSSAARAESLGLLEMKVDNKPDPTLTRAVGDVQGWKLKLPNLTSEEHGQSMVSSRAEKAQISPQGGFSDPPIAKASSRAAN